MTKVYTNLKVTKNTKKFNKQFNETKLHENSAPTAHQHMSYK